jgi:hypothetical protein
VSELDPTDRDDQDEAEALDVEEISDDDDDPEGDLAYPPDHLVGVNQYGVTEGEERVDEPLDERISRETPDVVMGSDDTTVGRLLEDDDDLDATAAPQRDLSAEESAVHLFDPDREPGE